MNVSVRLHGTARRLVGAETGSTTREVGENATCLEVLVGWLAHANDDVRALVLTDSDTLRPDLRVVVDDAFVDPEAPGLLREGSTVELFSPIAGG